MKRYTLDETWTLCLKMWKWIARRRKADHRLDIEDLKYEWIEKNGFKDENIAYGCFFCEYVRKRTGRMPDPGEASCVRCPAKKIDPEFNCCNNDYNFEYCPLDFYKKLLALNRKRLKKKAKPK